MEKHELESLVLIYKIPIDGVGLRDRFGIDATDQGSVWCSSLTVEGEVVQLRRNNKEIWVPIAAVRNMHPLVAKQAQQAEAKTVKAGPVAVVIPVPLPDEVTPEAPETLERKRKPGRPKKDLA